VWTFVAVTFALSWACQTPAILVLRAGLTPPGFVVLMMAVGSAGPSLVALWFRVLEGRRARIAPDRAAGVRVGQLALVALVALLFPVAAHLIGSAILFGFGQYRAQHVWYPPLQPEQIAIAIVAPLGEEFGWRGYALPRLQAALQPLAASLWIGLAWALWHIPTFFVPAARGTTPVELCLYLVAFLASSIIYTWLYNAGGGRMLGPLLAHLGVHMDNVFRASTMGDGIAPLAATSAVLTLMAAGLVLRGELHRDTAVIVAPPKARSGGPARAMLC
jgi:membrane protease YdiL (CAAX protease family)